MDNVHAYDVHAHTINVDEIASDSKNRIILRRLRRNNADERHKILSIQNYQYEEGEECTEYCPEGAHDMGWLGYFIGQNVFLEELHVCPFTPTSRTSVIDAIEPFLRGVSSNKSIREICLYQTDLLRGDLFTMLGPFFKNNYNLTAIYINNCIWGDEGWRLFALALGSCNKSLKNVTVQNNNIVEEGMVDIITALSTHPNLTHLDLYGNHLRKNGCMALATLLQCSTKVLQHLFISRNEINDEGIEALVPALATCSHLELLYLSDNPSITTRGWQSLATILEAPNSNLHELYISRNNADDEAVAAFANALVSNHTLHTLYLWGNRSITSIGWEAFSKVLCNTSSVNATFLSNHILQYTAANPNAIIGPLLELNGSRFDVREIATIKILRSHDDFDMLPFFEWEFKCLPMVLGWLERASEYEMPEDFEPNIDGKKLSTIYQFIRGMPLLYVETRLRKELEDIKAAEKQMEEELSQEFKQRKQSIMRKLGQKVENC